MPLIVTIMKIKINNRKGVPTPETPVPGSAKLYYNIKCLGQVPRTNGPSKTYHFSVHSKFLISLLTLTKKVKKGLHYTLFTD